MTGLFAVIVTWNGEKYIAKCLNSLLDADVPIQIVVVDNASSDQTVEIVRATCPNATIFRLARNLGFGRANNIGIKYAYDHGAEHVLLNNQDAYVEPGDVKTLAEFQRGYPKFGIVSPLHLDGTGAHLDARFCHHLSRGPAIRRLLSDLLLKGSLEKVYAAEFVNAAVWMLSRTCIEQVGLFNPAFDHYGEDLEYADRVRALGFWIGVAPGLRAFHDRGQNTPKEDVAIGRYLIQTRAIIRYRLSRKVPGRAFNFLSALSLVLLSRYPRNTSFANKLRIKATLLTSVFHGAVIVWGRQEHAYRGERAFFEEAAGDEYRYILKEEDSGESVESA